MSLMATGTKGEKIAEEIGDLLDKKFEEKPQVGGWLFGFRLSIRPVSRVEAAITHWWWLILHKLRREE